MFLADGSFDLEWLCSMSGEDLGTAIYFMAHEAHHRGIINLDERGWSICRQALFHAAHLDPLSPPAPDAM